MLLGFHTTMTDQPGRIWNSRAPTAGHTGISSEAMAITKIEVLPGNELSAATQVGVELSAK